MNPISARHSRRVPRILFLLWLLPFNVAAYTFAGRVVAVHDGDTLTVLRYGRAFKVRLNAIDAPELGQAYGRQSRKSLSSLCFGRYAVVESVGQDKYNRTLARVRCGALDVNAEQLRRGMAWHYAQYSHDPELQQLETEARGKGVGLWAAGQARPPWVFRHATAEKTGHAGQSATKAPLPRKCGTKRYCGEMESCAEARYYLDRCGVRTLDGDHDGTPCERLCTSSPD